MYVLPVYILERSSTAVGVDSNKGKVVEAVSVAVVDAHSRGACRVKLRMFCFLWHLTKEEGPEVLVYDGFEKSMICLNLKSCISETQQEHHSCE